MTAALDQTGATRLLAWAEGRHPEIALNGSRALGPFVAAYGAWATFAGGTVTLSPPKNIRLADATVRFRLTLDITLDVSRLIPDFCLPQACADVPFVGRVCIPPKPICIDWPSVTIPVSYSEAATFTADLTVEVHLQEGLWVAETVLLATPSVQIGSLDRLLQTIRAAADAVLRNLPYIGPLLGKALDALIGSVSGALGGTLGSIITAVVGGTRFRLYEHSATLSVPIDGTPITVTLDQVQVDVVASDENELVLGIDVS
jgi:hypothetical protein